MSQIPKESCHSNFTNTSIEQSSTFNRSKLYLFIGLFVYSLGNIWDDFTLYLVVSLLLLRINRIRTLFAVMYALFFIGCFLLFIFDFFISLLIIERFLLFLNVFLLFWTFFFSFFECFYFFGFISCFRSTFLVLLFPYFFFFRFSFFLNYSNFCPYFPFRCLVFSLSYPLYASPFSSVLIFISSCSFFLRNKESKFLLVI